MSQEQKKWRKIVENSSEETKRVIEFAELLEGTRLGMDMERRDEDDGLDVESPKSRRRRNREVAEDHNDWSVGSTNRRKQMYPNMHSEEERNRVGCVGRGSGTRKLEMTKSQFLDVIYRIKICLFPNINKIIIFGLFPKFFRCVMPAIKI